jgi:membrane-bound metal-dependent hydrolase YbcI (DUF457 family)
MDTLTHTLIGVGMANAFFRRRVGPAAVPILAIASNLPDVDALVHLTGDPTAILLRRTFGHSLFLLPVWCALLTWVMGRFYPKIPRRTLYGLIVLGAGVHLLFDLVNSFGVVLLWPLSDWRPELSMIFIIDLTLTGLLLFPLLLCIPKAMRPLLMTLSRLSMACVIVYVLFCGVNRYLAAEVLAAEAGHLARPPDFAYVFPEPLGPHRWRGVLREGDTYRLYLIHSLTGVIEARGEVKTRSHDPAVKQVRETPLARRLEWFFKAPVWEVGDASGTDRSRTVSVTDLRFTTLVIDGAPSFIYRFRIEDSGRIEGPRSIFFGSE